MYDFFTTNENSIQSKALIEHTNILKIFKKKVHKLKLLSFRSEKSTKFEISQFYITLYISKLKKKKLEGFFYRGLLRTYVLKT